MTFTASDVIRPKQYQSLDLVPFFRVHDSRYMLYWRLATPQQYDQVVQQLKVEEQAKLILEQNTLDRVTAGEQQPEMDHAFQGEKTEVGEFQGRHWRDSGAWFSYTLKARSETVVDLMLIYCNQDRSQRFDILVNDTRLTTVSLGHGTPEDFTTVRYRIPQDLLTKAKDGLLTVRFQAQANARTARVCEVRLVKADQ